VWSETIRRDGGQASFEGAGAPSVLVQPMVVFVVVFILGLVFRRVLPGVVHLTLLVVCALFVVLSIRRARGRVSAASVDVDGQRVRIDPWSRLIGGRELAIDAIDCFATEPKNQLQREQPRYLTDGSDEWHAVLVHFKSGEREPALAFRNREHALFVAQRLEALVERACVVRGLVRNTRPRDLESYR
jgi:hypothetical protein